MPGLVPSHDHRDRRHRPALFVAILVAVIAGTASADDVASGLRPSAEVRLSADKVRYWDDQDGSRWVILEGHAAALQDGEGVRGDAMAARVRADRVRGQAGFAVEVLAQGHARMTHPDSRVISDRRSTLGTTGQVKFTAYTKGGLTSLSEAPRPIPPLMTKAFPELAEIAPPAENRSAAPAGVPPVDLGPKPTASGSPGPVVKATLGDPIPDPVPPLAKGKAKRDPAVQKAQGDGGGFEPPPIVNGPDDPMAPVGDDQGLPPGFNAPGDVDRLDPLPDALPNVPGSLPEVEKIRAPVLPDSRQAFNVTLGPNAQVNNKELPNGDVIVIIRGGVNVVSNMPKKVAATTDIIATVPYTTLDVTADNIVIWTRKKGDKPADPARQGEDDLLQLYAEGHVRIRQDERKVAGNGDEKVFDFERVFIDLKTERMHGENGRIFSNTPGLLAPLRTDGEVINQYRVQNGVTTKGAPTFGKFIRVDKASNTGSRFPVPGYRFDSQSLEIEEKTVPLVDQAVGAPVGRGRTPRDQDTIMEFRAFNNLYYLGDVPVFYWPFMKFDSEFDPVLRNFRFQTGNVFGQTVDLDLSGFRLLNIRKPRFVDTWNIDVDYLSYRGIGLGSEFAYFGRDFWGDLMDPYDKRKLGRDVDHPYAGYLDVWGLQDSGRDVLGPGPAIVTNGPPGAGMAGYQRTSVPAFQQFRGRSDFRHMVQLQGEDAPDDQDFRVQVEAAYVSDRNFLEEYYKRLFDTGLDQETLVYGIKQTQNRAITIQTEANLQNWYTDTQWLPKVEYTRLGDSFLNNWVNISTRSGIDYASTHTDVSVDNPNVFAFIPRDPVSNTSGVLNTGRAYSAAEVDVPFSLGQTGALKVVPYGQGQVVGWNNQIGDVPVGRVWGAFGIKANIMAWRTFDGPWTESELLNIHGLAHKVNFLADFRTAYSNVNLNSIGVQDDLDDNTYEYARRYFAMTNYVGGLLPLQYDPRLLTLRRTVSPITGTTDIQGTIETAHLGIHQRLQTKRGKDGYRRIIDYMTFDLDTTYFPNASRDNFGKPFGQNMYNYEWFFGDRTSFTSYGWFEVWKVQGQPILLTNPRHTNDPFGLNVITSGFQISRPPRGSLFLGYSIINTGPISTSALNTSFTYWLSPKWYAFAAMSYDFGNAILLGTTFSVTKITKDYLTSVGLTVDPQRMNYNFAFEISPRFSPNVRFGSTVGSRFDSRFAPSQ